jgi:septation ring formation regulator EzrA
MSKTSLKKHLQSLTKEQVIEQVLSLYDSCKPAKEYLEYLLDPDEKEQFEKYKAIIVNEFYPKGKYIEAKTRFSVAKKAIADFRRLNPSPGLLADLMLTLPEMACKFTNDYGDMWEQYYTSAATNFELALKFLQKHNLLEQFKTRCKECVKYSKPCGYGFADDIGDLFYEYYA